MQAQLNRLLGKDARSHKGPTPWKDGSTVAQVLVLDAAFKALQAKDSYNHKAIQKLIRNAFVESFKTGKNGTTLGDGEVAHWEMDNLRYTMTRLDHLLWAWGANIPWDRRNEMPCRQFDCLRDRSVR